MTSSKANTILSLLISSRRIALHRIALHPAGAGLVWSHLRACLAGSGTSSRDEQTSSLRALMASYRARLFLLNSITMLPAVRCRSSAEMQIRRHDRRRHIAPLERRRSYQLSSSLCA